MLLVYAKDTSGKHGLRGTEVAHSELFWSPLCLWGHQQEDICAFHAIPGEIGVLSSPTPAV